MARLRPGDRASYQEQPVIIERVEELHRADGSVDTLYVARLAGSIARVHAPARLFKEAYYVCECGADAVSWFGTFHSSYCPKYRRD